MENFDVCATLREYRAAHDLTQKEMSIKLNISRSSYERLENGTRSPTLKEVEYIFNLLNLPGPIAKAEPLPMPALKWHQSKMWRWIMPEIFAYLIVDLAITVEFATYENGKQIIQDDLPIFIFFVFGLIFCGIYWYIKPPEMRKPTLKEIACGLAAISGFLLLILNAQVIALYKALKDPYLTSIPVWFWIMVALAPLILLLHFWNSRLPLSKRFKNVLNPLIIKIQFHFIPKNQR